MSDRARVLQTARIISIAITMGPAMFVGVVFFLLGREDGAFGSHDTAPLISYVSLALALAAIGAAVVIPRVIRAQAKDPLQGFQTAVIVRAAVLEAPALLGCVAYLLEGRENPIGAGVAIAMIVMLAGFTPTESRLDAWLSAPGASRDG
jgi:hypothetical protein